ncbi:hypothetical protein SynA1560_00168 [Synechococcus sp. A15-60]|nr:hypothetical protein SynA1560_00168 [Synechococcus sp. A15-60]
MISDPITDRGFSQGTGKSGSPLDAEAVGCRRFRGGRPTGNSEALQALGFCFWLLARRSDSVV